MKIIYSHFSRFRLKEFQTQTIIKLVDNKKIVIKKALTEEAVSHVNNMHKHYEKLSQNYNNLVYAKCKIAEQSVEFELLS